MKEVYMKKFSIIFFLLLCTQFTFSEENLNYTFGIDLMIATPAKIQGAFTEVSPGLSARWQFMNSGAIGIDYLYTGKDYFYLSDAAWHGPSPWYEVKIATPLAEESSWIFYQTRHYLSPQGMILIPVAGIDLLISGGPAINFVVASEASDFYPEENAVFEDAASKLKVFLGYSFKLGAEMQLWDSLAVSLQYIFIANSFQSFFTSFSVDPLTYIKNSGSLVLAIGARI